MVDHESKFQPHRVLISSANSLFGKGLRRLFEERWGGKAVVIGLTTNLDETLNAVDALMPDLVILDYDDRSIDRDRFLSHYVTGHHPMQVALISLLDSGAVIVYDRKTLTPSQAEDWLNMPWLSTPHSKSEQSQEQ